MWRKLTHTICSMKMKRLKKQLLRALLLLSLTLFYCEYLVYYLVMWQCHYPIPLGEEVTTMVLADTHLLGARNGHWFDKLRREWQMQRAFQTAVTYFQPKQVFFLGDLFDEGKWCPPHEFSYYVRRFRTMFEVDETRTKVQVMAGNHDIGFHYSTNPFLVNRFRQAFGTKPVRYGLVQGLPFVVINSMAFEGDSCFLCKEAEDALTRIGRKLSQSPDLARPILLSHFPLFRESDEHCDEVDEAPADEKGTKFRERWDCLSREASTRLLSVLRPRLVLSGHTHHGCNTTHLLSEEGESVTELSVSSFSWRNKKNPAFLLGRFSNITTRVEKCFIPDENNVINVYIASSLLYAVSFLIK